MLVGFGCACGAIPEFMTILWLSLLDSATEFAELSLRYVQRQRANVLLAQGDSQGVVQ
jgi:hypothetical protein